MNIPNALTVLRIVLIPVFVALFYLPFGWAMVTASVVFTVAGVTDWLDGYLARKLNQSTPFGAFLDPVADKLIVVIALALLIEHFNHWWFTLPAIVIVGREIVVSALREWMAELGKRTSVAVSLVGKVKTVLQMAAIIVLLASGQYAWLTLLGGVLIYIAAVLTLWSMLLYLRAAWPEFEIGR